MPSATVIGTGALVSSDALRVGVNVITLTATNSAGESASASVTITVGDDLAPAGPMLAVGPASLGWHVAAGSTPCKAAALSISNAGGGDLSWTASSDQPWLTLGAASGTMTEGANAVTLSLQADPSGLADSDTAMAHVTINAGRGGQRHPPGQPEQRLRLGAAAGRHPAGGPSGVPAAGGAVKRGMSR